MIQTPYVKEIIPSTINYFETEDYVFVHGWIPCDVIPYSRSYNLYLSKDNWRKASTYEWKEARWVNGMEAHARGVRIPGKTIVCGHYHCSYGHSRYEGIGSEFDSDAVFTPYRAEGIIAMDACTAHSGFANCIVIDQ